MLVPSSLLPPPRAASSASSQAPQLLDSARGCLLQESLAHTTEQESQGPEMRKRCVCLPIFATLSQVLTPLVPKVTEAFLACGVPTAVTLVLLTLI